MHPFYGKKIDPDAEQKVIEKLLAKFRHLSPSLELKKTIYATLSQAKTSGLITIPFKVIYRKSPDAKHRDYIEVLLDTKV